MLAVLLQGGLTLFVKLLLEFRYRLMEVMRIVKQVYDYLAEQQICYQNDRKGNIHGFLFQQLLLWEYKYKNVAFICNKVADEIQFSCSERSPTNSIRRCIDFETPGNKKGCRRSESKIERSTTHS